MTGSVARRRWPLVAVASGAMVLTGILALSDGADGKAKENTVPSGILDEIRRQTMVDQETLSGKLGYTGNFDVTANGTGGVLTALPGLGSVIQRGDSVYQVDNLGVPLLYGGKPFWRELRSGMDRGPDVTVLETNLRELGYRGFVVDDRFDANTAAAIRKWQKKLGLPQTGSVPPGSVVIQPGPLRVSEVTATLGGPAQGRVLSGTSTTRVITVEVPVDRQTLAQDGAKVEITLPDGKTGQGRITSVGTVATKPGSGPVTIPVEVALNDPAVAGRLDAAPVDVAFTSGSKQNVLTVPVGALLALPEGGYAVETAQPDGSTRRVPVELGMFAQGRVEVSGDGLAEGAKVKVAGI